MATLRRGRALIALGALALIPAALVGCGSDDSADAPADDNASSQTEESAPEEAAPEQSKEDACAIALGAINDLSTNMTELAAAPDDAEELKETVDSTLSDASDQISNEEVSVAFTKVSDGFAAIFEGQSGGDSSDVLNDVTTASAELGTLCA
ncbi:hypothetical protein [Microbacterium sp.]|uniref:hypothetical protein n=1 Tax=Microbacterium sp. TaxID=51671 RepID=UPI003F9704A2